MHRIVLIGPPASGKGTQARRIEKLLALPTLGTGALLRREVERGSDLGQEVDGYLRMGNYVPDALIMKMVNCWLKEHAEGSWLLDGFPRTLTQAESLEQGQYPPSLVIGLDVPVGELERRIANRRECDGCGSTVTVQHFHETDCPSCNQGALKSRDDDQLESFRVRYANYREQTLPLFDYYRAKGKLLLVNGGLSPDEVFHVIQNHLTTQISHG